ncbi:phage tail tape measure protein [Providencia rettgeri]|uniref:phage tail tape measure protein n=1 Tax=Providencia rettgeri TaxID=587 RepID=UPI00244C73EE|nr:phage tail tape measure protein [Providencia rettgeri]MDH2394602.1 phage tail tape measure protein [Providencia rettgeri]
MSEQSSRLAIILDSAAAQRNSDTLASSLNRLTQRGERAVESTDAFSASLKRMAATAAGALSISAVLKYSDSWMTLSNKLANATKASETQLEVMKRVFDISQETRASLDGTATLYARLERGTREYGTSATELAKLTTIINQGFAVSGATAQEAENAIIQLSQGIASGVLRGEEFNSVAEQGSRLMVALADSLGVNIGQLRAMAAQGKLTNDVVVNGLLSQGDAIAKEFANTTATLSQGLLIANNNLTKFLGDDELIKSFSAGLRDLAVSGSENLESLTEVFLIGAGVIGARYVGALANASKEKLRIMTASAAQAKSEAAVTAAAEQAALSTLRRANADKAAIQTSHAKMMQEYEGIKATNAASVAEVKLAQAEVNSIKVKISQIEAEKALEVQRAKSQISEQGRIATATRMAELQQSSLVLTRQLAAAETATANARAAAISTAEVKITTSRSAMTAATVAATNATNTYTAAQSAAAASARAASGSLNLLKGSLALVGGPVGVAMLAGAGLYYYSQQAEQAREKTRAFTDEIPGLISNLKKLNKVELDSVSVKLIKNVSQLKEDLATADAGIESLKGTYLRAQKVVDSGKGLSWDRQEAVEAAKKASDDLKLAYAERQAIVTKLSLAEEAQTKVNQQLSSVVVEQMHAARQQSDALESAEPKVKMLADAQSFLAQKLGISTNAMKQFNAQSLLLNYGGDDANKFIQGLKQQVELSEKTGKARAQLAAEQAAMRSGANPEGIKEAIRLAGIEYDNLEKQRELTKSKNATYSESAAQKMLSSLKEQQMVLIQQRDTNGSLGSQQQALVKWEQQLADIKSKKTLTADQKSLLANAELITLEMKRNAEIEKTIQHREAEVKIASFHKQMMEEAEQAQKRYNQTIETAGMGTLAQGRMQERFQIEAEFERKKADLQKQFQDKSTGMTKAMYDEETQFISSQLQARLAMLEDFHVKQDAMRGNWTLGVHMALQNYADNARDYSQQAEGFITNSLQNITSGSADALTDIVTNSKNAFDAIGDFFGDLSKSIIKDLIRIAIQAQITNAITGLFGGIAGGSGAAAGAGASTSGTGAMGMSTSWRAYSSGGYTGRGGKYDPAGIVHKDEFVFNKEATNSIGKENLYDLMNTGEMPNYQLSPDAYAMKYLHPASQTNNTTNNSSVNNATETNENSQSTITIHQTIEQTISVNGNGDKALIKALQQAASVGAKRGADEAVARIQRDFATNGNTRQILER